MSLHISINLTGDTCDMCRKPMVSEDNIGFFIQSRSRRHTETIWVHESCLNKAIKTAKLELNQPIKEND